MARTPGKSRGCLAILLVIAGFLGIMIVCGVVTAVGGAFVFDEQRFVPGDAGHFDPVARFNDIAGVAGSDHQFYYLEAQYVRSDGTLDLNASYEPKVTYRFVREADNPAQARPVGAGGNTSGKQWEVVQVELSHPFELISITSNSTNSSTLNLGMNRDTWQPMDSSPGQPAPAPACPFKQLWDVAVTKDAPRDAVAIIRYRADGYTFEIEGTSIDLKFGMDCQLQGASLSPTQAPMPTTSP